MMNAYMKKEYYVKEQGSSAITNILIETELVHSASTKAVENKEITYSTDCEKQGHWFVK